MFLFSFISLLFSKLPCYATLQDFRNGKVDTAFIPKHEAELNPVRISNNSLFELYHILVLHNRHVLRTLNTSILLSLVFAY